MVYAGFCCGMEYFTANYHLNICMYRKIHTEIDVDNHKLDNNSYDYII